MMKRIVITMSLLLLASVNVYASIYAEADTCISSTGKVLEAVNDELFTVEFCGDVRVFKEFSYCYGVANGDIVLFDSSPVKCEMTGFTVIRNDVQCGVLCL